MAFDRYTHVTSVKDLVDKAGTLEYPIDLVVNPTSDSPNLISTFYSPDDIYRLTEKLESLFRQYIGEIHVRPNKSEMQDA